MLFRSETTGDFRCKQTVHLRAAQEKGIQLGDGRRRVTKECFYEWYASQNQYHIVSEQTLDPLKMENNRDVEAHRRKVIDRDGHSKNVGNKKFLTMKEAGLLADTTPATIHGKYVIYRGESSALDGIQYVNVEEYLKSL